MLLSRSDLHERANDLARPSIASTKGRYPSLLGSMGSDEETIRTWRRDGGRRSGWSRQTLPAVGSFVVGLVGRLGWRIVWEGEPDLWGLDDIRDGQDAELLPHIAVDEMTEVLHGDLAVPVALTRRSEW